MFSFLAVTHLHYMYVYHGLLSQHFAVPMYTNTKLLNIILSNVHVHVCNAFNCIPGRILKLALPLRPPTLTTRHFPTSNTLTTPSQLPWAAWDMPLVITNQSAPAN